MYKHLLTFRVWAVSVLL